MPAETIARLSVRRVRFSRFKGFPALFQDYSGDFERLSEFYAGDFRDRSERVRAVERAAAVERDRATLAEVMLEQNERWGMSAATRSNIEALRKDDAAAVVTGQQVGIFAGPLYTILKAITTIQLARQLSDESGRAVVPVFWLGVEDHDFEEVASVHLLRRNEPEALRYREAPDGPPGPVGRLRMSSEIDRLVNQIDEILPPTDFKPEVMHVLRETYHSGETFGDAFARLLRALLPDSGLVLLSSDDARLKRLVAPLYRREIADPQALSTAVGGVSTRLAERYHQQVHVTPTNLFLLDGDGRYPIDLEGDRFRLRGIDRAFSADELLKMLDDHPERFSPNVVLRPLTQDTLLPTATYVGGPGEISYFAQYRAAYEWAGVPMPLIYPRASVTLVESKVEKVLEKYNLDVPDFEDDVDRLFQRVVVDAMDVDLDRLFRDASQPLHESVNTVKQSLETLDPTLGKAAEATRSALMGEFEKLKGKAVRLEKKNKEVIRNQLAKAHANLYPNGILQERALSLVYFLNKYGLSLTDELAASLSTDTSEHQVVGL